MFLKKIKNIKEKCIFPPYYLLYVSLDCTSASMVAQTIKNPPVVQETRVQSLCLEDSLKKGISTTSVFLPGKSHGQRSLVGYSPWGQKELT